MSLETLSKSVKWKISFCTVQLSVTYENGMSATGTGFIVYFNQKGKEASPVVVTNRHVFEIIEDKKPIKAVRVICNFTLEDEAGMPRFGVYHGVDIQSFEDKYIFHPDKDVDLAAFALAPVEKFLKQKGVNIFYVPLETNIIPSEQFRLHITPVEDVLMVGYPNGLWDTKHNMPIVRRGITATHANIPFEGKPIFLTDIASINGSSGSPVFLLKDRYKLDENNRVVPRQPLLKLLGVHFAGYEKIIAGDIAMSKNAQIGKPIVESRFPIHIGLAINSMEIFVLEKAWIKTFISD